MQPASPDPTPAQAGSRPRALRGWAWWLRPRAIVLLVICGIAANRAGAWASYWLSAKTVAGEPAAGPGGVWARSLDFGEVWEDKDFHWTLVIENTGAAAVEVTNLRGVCACTRVGQGDVVLPPHAQAEIPLIIDLYQVRSARPGRVRPVEVAVTAQVGPQGGRPQEARWAVTGRVRRYLDCDPLVIAMGEDLIAGVGGDPRTVRVRPAPAVRSVRIKRSPAGWDCRLRGTPGDPSGYVLSIVPLRDAAGSFRETVELDALAADGRVVATQPIAAEGRAVEPVELLPRVADLGPVPVGSGYRARFTVVTRAGGTVEIDRTVDDDARVAISRSSGPEQVEVEGTVLAPGYGEATGTVRARHNGSACLPLTYRVRWYGVEGGR